MDEAGSPFCVTVDGRTVADGPEHDTVTVRDRDTKAQERVAIIELVPRIRPTVEPPRPPRT
jgi:glycyl-tRNA synthetase